jgi:hypothetical protein
MSPGPGRHKRKTLSASDLKNGVQSAAYATTLSLPSHCKSRSPFLRKLWEILEEDNSAISWEVEGEFFTVHDKVHSSRISSLVCDSL